VAEEAKPQSAKKPGTVKVKLLRAYWPDDTGKSIPAGSVVEIALDRAKEMIANKQAERTDPLPGDKANED
jgi:hypothetical protein